MFNKFKIELRKDEQKKPSPSLSHAQAISEVQFKTFVDRVIAMAKIYIAPVNWLEGWGTIFFERDLSLDQVQVRKNAIEIWVRGFLSTNDSINGSVHTVTFIWIEQDSHTFNLEAYLNPPAQHLANSGGGGGSPVIPAPPPPPPIS